MSARRGTRRRGAIALLCVIALHIAIAWRLNAAIVGRPSRDARATPARVTMRLITPPATAAQRATEPVPILPSAIAPRGRAPPVARTPTLPGLEAPIAAAPTEATSRGELAASAAVTLPSLMDTDATRRAIRNSARRSAQPGHVAGADDEPHRASTQERLAAEIKAAGKGDCVKGEYLGAGMGLLSLPFLAVAAARGACAQ